MYALTQRERTRLSGILARLASPFEGERAAAALLASAFVEKHGLGWFDPVAMLEPAPQPTPGTPAPQPAAAQSLTISEPAGKPERRRRNQAWRGYDRRRRAAPGQSVNIAL